MMLAWKIDNPVNRDETKKKKNGEKLVILDDTLRERIG